MKKIFLITTMLLIFWRGSAQAEVDYYNSGYAKTMLENYEGAVVDFNSALKINPNYSKARLARGIAFQQLMNNEKDKNRKAIYYVLCVEDFDYLITKKIDKQYLTIRGNVHMSWYFYSKKIKYKTLACGDWKKAYALGDIKAGEFLTSYCK